MKEFDELLDIAKALNAPNGCPWDREQNFFTLQPFVLEEAHEVIEAVDHGDNKKIVDELGDLFYTIIFYCKVAEREERFTIKDLLMTIKEKLIRRHPHVFGGQKMEDKEEVIRRWEKIKQEEAAHVQRKSALDGIPERMPSLTKAQKIVKKALRAKYPFQAQEEKLSEEELGEEILHLVTRAEQQGIDVDGALRRFLLQFEESFRDWEQTSP
jgi:MazG family protein